MTENDQLEQEPTDGCDSDCGAGTETDGPSPGLCRYNENSDDGEVFRTTCDFNLTVFVEIEFDSLIGENEVFVFSGNGNTLEITTEDRPAVAACCTDIEESSEYGGPFASTCQTPHHRGCVSDLINFVCHQPGKWIKAEGDKGTFGTGFNASARAAANVLNNSRTDCYNFFWQQLQPYGDPDGGGPIEGDPLAEVSDWCSIEAGGGSNPFEWITPQNPVNSSLPGTRPVVGVRVQFDYSPDFVEGTTFVAPIPLGTQQIACVDPDFNNGWVTLPYELADDSEFPIPPFGGAPMDDFGDLVASTNTDVEGPDWNGEQILGAGQFHAGGSVLPSETSYYYGFQNLRIEGWKIVGSGAPLVGTSQVSYPIENWAMESMGVSEAANVNQWKPEWEAAPGSIAFNLSGTVDDAGYAVIATNSTPISIKRVNGSHTGCPGTQSNLCLKTGPFDVDYEDAFGGTWLLHVDEAFWDL